MVVEFGDLLALVKTVEGEKRRLLNIIGRVVIIFEEIGIEKIQLEDRSYLFYVMEEGGYYSWGIRMKTPTDKNIIIAEETYDYGEYEYELNYEYLEVFIEDLPEIIRTVKERLKKDMERTRKIREGLEERLKAIC